METTYTAPAKPYWARRQTCERLGGLTQEFVRARTKYIQHKYEMLPLEERRGVDAHLLRLETRLGITHAVALELLFALGSFLNENSPR